MKHVHLPRQALDRWEMVTQSDFLYVFEQGSSSSKDLSLSPTLAGRLPRRRLLMAVAAAITSRPAPGTARKRSRRSALASTTTKSRLLSTRHQVRNTLFFFFFFFFFLFLFLFDFDGNDRFAKTGSAQADTKPLKTRGAVCHFRRRWIVPSVSC
jgi:hypothetical protein